ncbi:MAG: DUF1127 domain-containing protein [Pseudomonadota bacterium]
MTSITDIPAGRSLRTALNAIGASFTDTLVALGRARSHAAEIERYMAMSDEELASRGIKRDYIVAHVFQNYADV